MNEATSRRRHPLFGHVRLMDQAAPAYQALHLSVMSRQGSGQFDAAKRNGTGTKLVEFQKRSARQINLDDYFRLNVGLKFRLFCVRNRCKT